MSVDTRNKRFAMINPGLPLRVMPNPDGTFATAADRKQIAFLYPGTLTAAALTQGPDWFEKLNGSSNRLEALAG